MWCRKRFPITRKLLQNAGMMTWQPTFPTRRLRMVCALVALAPVLMLAASAQVTRKDLLAQLEKLPHPDGPEQFETPAHLPCLNQGKTSVCWSYATSSFVESELARLRQPAVRLSVMYPAYCEFLEKTRRYVQCKGDSRFDPGDLFTGVAEAIQKYGAVPASAYDKDIIKKLPDHTRLYAELWKLMDEVKKNGQWDEEAVLGQVKGILDRRLGSPPASFTFEGQSYTPGSFRDHFVNLPWKDYVLLTSFEYAPFNTFTEFKVPDNWHHNTNYLNLPLAVFYDAFKQALRSGFTVAVSIDTTEPSYRLTGRYGFIFECDLGTGLTQDVREVQFKNGVTTDDHAVHILGYHQFDGEDWFLAKDSWKTTWQNANQGNLFLHSSYVKMKILAFMVHRDGVASVLKKTSRPSPLISAKP